MSTPDNPPLSRRAARQAELSAQDAPPEGFAQPLTRRTRGGAPVSIPSSPPTDVLYRTQVRPRVPHYDAAPTSHAANPDAVHSPLGAAAAPLPSSAAPVAVPLVVPLVGPLGEPPLAPPAAAGPEHARRRDFRPPAEQQPEPGRAAFAADTFDTTLEYHTQGTPSVQPQQLSHALDQPSSPLEQTLSRREMRALRDQAGLASDPALESGVIEPLIADSPRVAMPQPSAELVPVALAAPPAQPSTENASSSAPTGSHWSVGIHDVDDPFENTFSREVGSTASLSNTNALVLPEMPRVSIAGPVAGTGEIIITGMVDLPRVVSSTGTMPTVHESPDIDDLFEPGDLVAAPSDAAPVSALKAVSRHTGSFGVMATGKGPSSNTVTTILVATTVVMAVVAIGLFVLAAVNGLF